MSTTSKPEIQVARRRRARGARRRRRGRHLAQTAAPVQTPAPITVQAPQMPSFADVVDRVKPAVVSVRVKTRQVADRDDDGPGSSGPTCREGLRALLPRVPRRRGLPRRQLARPAVRARGPERRFGRQRRAPASSSPPTATW